MICIFLGGLRVTNPTIELGCLSVRASVRASVRVHIEAIMWYIMGMSVSYEVLFRYVVNLSVLLLKKPL